MNADRKYSSNTFAKILLSVLKKIFPELLQRCPYPPMSLEKVNFTAPYIYMAMIPVGTYRITGVLRSRNSDSYVNVSLLAEMA